MNRRQDEDHVRNSDEEQIEAKNLLDRGLQRSHNYRPLATRLPVLLLFAGLLAFYVALIELALHHTSEYEVGGRRRLARDESGNHNVQWVGMLSHPTYGTSNSSSSLQPISSDMSQSLIQGSAPPRNHGPEKIQHDTITKAVPERPASIRPVMDHAGQDCTILGKHVVGRQISESNLDSSLSSAIESSSNVAGTVTAFQTETVTFTSTLTTTLIPTEVVSVTITVTRSPLARRNTIQQSRSSAPSPSAVTSNTITSFTECHTSLPDQRGRMYAASPREKFLKIRQDETLTLTTTVTEIVFETVTVTAEAVTITITSEYNAYLTLVFPTETAKDSSWVLPTLTDSSETPPHDFSSQNTVIESSFSAAQDTTSRSSFSTAQDTTVASGLSSKSPVVTTNSQSFAQSTSTVIIEPNISTGPGTSSKPDSVFQSTFLPTTATEAYLINSWPGTNSTSPSASPVTFISGAYLVLASMTPTTTANMPQTTQDTTGPYGEHISTPTQTSSSSGRTDPTPIVATPIDIETRTSATSPISTPSATPWPIKQLDGSERVVDPPFTNLTYFAATFLGPLLAVIAKAFWDIIYSSFKMMEPFERLCQKSGYPARHTLFAEYLSCSASWDAWEILIRGRVLSFVNLLIFALVTAISALAASSMRVQGMQNCFIDRMYFRCAPAWILELPVLRATEGLLIIATLSVLCVAIICLVVKSTKLPTEPSSICSIASLYNDQTLIDDIQAVEPTANISVFKAAVQQRLRVGYHEDKTGERIFGISRTGTRAWLPRDRLASAKQHTKYESVPNPAIASFRWLSSDNMSLQLQSTLLDAAQLTSTIALLLMVVIYMADSKNDAFNNFFNSKTWRPTLTFSAVAVLVDVQWKRLEREIRITDPYRRLAKGHAHPQHTILISLHGTCWSRLPASISNLLRNRDMWFQTLVTVVACLSEFNIIAASTFPFNDGQTYILMRVSGFTTISITALMTIVMIICMGWWRRILVIKKMPRCPDTIGAAFSYLCDSQMAREFSRAHFDTVDDERRSAIVVASGKRYRFGIKTGADGISRWCIDFEDAWKSAPVGQVSFFEALRLDLPSEVDLNVQDQYA